VVLLDPDGRVLLFHLAPSGGIVDGPYWYLPGGGMRWGESVAAAAARELREETGIADASLGPIVGERPDVSFRFRGRRVVQDEWYVAGSVSSPHVGSGRDGDGERRAVEAHRWWTLQELAVSNETVFPPDIADLVRRAATWSAGSS
jgi:8-oxo-dGTP pyrophosphatase MutT (NUDIX family)